MHKCGLTYQCRTQSVVCVCLQVTALPAGIIWLCCFEVRLHLSDKQTSGTGVGSWLTHLFSMCSLHSLLFPGIPNKVEVKSNMCLCVIVFSKTYSNSEIYSYIEGKLATKSMGQQTF